MDKGGIKHALYMLEITKLGLLEDRATKEIDSALSHIEMAEDFLADLVFPVEEDIEEDE